eukprot:TRINITY_DN73314_c0_g1_i1.p1 TRINITY_DN73314_c0_g1~~TRINITY_DN73314_c0_g1_i1.p1  ORF type:complete len:403 (-),score=23.91 TRINITY_DN73314_c0_g1_i1:410-1618(-)
MSHSSGRTGSSRGKWRTGKLGGVLPNCQLCYEAKSACRVVKLHDCVSSGLRNPRYYLCGACVDWLLYEQLQSGVGDKVLFCILCDARLGIRSRALLEPDASQFDIVCHVQCDKCLKWHEVGRGMQSKLESLDAAFTCRDLGSDCPPVPLKLQCSRCGQEHQASQSEYDRYKSDPTFSCRRVSLRCLSTAPAVYQPSQQSIHTNKAVLYLRGHEDPYMTMGLKKDASLPQVRAKWKVLARLWHPDKQRGGQGDGARFVRLHRAYTRILEQKLQQVSNRGRPLGSSAGAGASNHFRLRFKQKPPANWTPSRTKHRLHGKQPASMLWRPVTFQASLAGEPVRGPAPIEDGRRARRPSSTSSLGRAVHCHNASSSQPTRSKRCIASDPAEVATEKRSTSRRSPRGV